MPRHRIPPLARVRLARSLPRLLAWPAIVIGTGAMAIATWSFGSFGAGAGGAVFVALGALLILVGLVVAAVLLSIRLEVQEAAVRLHWLGGERVYTLTRGPVTRVRLRGPQASKLRPRFGMFGWAIGPTRLRGEEEIHVVRLARTPTAILVPTERGRLAIAAADEDELLDALTRAARARQRLDELAGVSGAVERPAATAGEHGPAEAEPADEAEPEPAATAPAAPSLDVEPRVLTGIERALLEQRLAEERAAAEAPAAVQTEAADVAAAEEAPPAPEAAAPSARGDRMRRLRRAAGFVLLPLAGSGAAWGIGLVAGSYPPPETDAGRLTALALVLAGPATSVGTIMALTWWPRLVGVVVSGGLVASAFVGRALLV